MSSWKTMALAALASLAASGLAMPAPMPTAAAAPQVTDESCFSDLLSDIWEIATSTTDGPSPTAAIDTRDDEDDDEEEEEEEEEDDKDEGVNEDDNEDDDDEDDAAKYEYKDDEDDEDDGGKDDAWIAQVFNETKQWRWLDDGMFSMVVGPNASMDETTIKCDEVLSDGSSLSALPSKTLRKLCKGICKVVTDSNGHPEKVDKKRLGKLKKKYFNQLHRNIPTEIDKARSKLVKDHDDYRARQDKLSDTEDDLFFRKSMLNLASKLMVFDISSTSDSQDDFVKIDDRSDSGGIEQLGALEHKLFKLEDELDKCKGSQESSSSKPSKPIETPGPSGDRHSDRPGERPGEFGKTIEQLGESIEKLEKEVDECKAAQQKDKDEGEGDWSDGDDDDSDDKEDWGDDDSDGEDDRGDDDSEGKGGLGGSDSDGAGDEGHDGKGLKEQVAELNANFNKIEAALWKQVGKIEGGEAQKKKLEKQIDDIQDKLGDLSVGANLSAGSPTV